MASCGGYHNVFLSDDGQLHSMGWNNLGQLGYSSPEKCGIPTPIPNLPQIQQICCGFYYTMCLDIDGKLWGFGSNGECQLASSKKQISRVSQAQLIENIPPIHFICCGEYHTLALSAEDSTLWSFGKNDCGQLCLGYSSSTVATPTKSEFSYVGWISAGVNFTLFQTSDGQIYECGYDGVNGNACTSPRIIPDLPLNIKYFSSGWRHSIFLDIEGNVYSVGNNRYDQCGQGGVDGSSVITKILNIPVMVTISAGRFHSMMIDEQGNLWVCGLNRYGNLGLPQDKVPVPTKVPNFTKYCSNCWFF